MKTGLTAARAAEVRQRFGTPTYVYERAALEAAARAALAFPAPFGYTLRYAMKANPNHGILALFRELGLHIDASSDHEVERALRAGSRRRCPRPGSPNSSGKACSTTPARCTSSSNTDAWRRAATWPCG